MRVQNTIVKLESNEQVSKLEPLSRGPFEISHGEVQLKPVFTPFSAEWGSIENAKYVAFLLYHRSPFECWPHTKLWSLYEQMSGFVETRNFRQCKNHHNRFRKASMSINNTIQHFVATIDNFRRLLAMEIQNLKIFEAQRRALNSNVAPGQQYIFYEPQQNKLSVPKIAYPQSMGNYGPEVMNFYQNQMEAQNLPKPMFFIQTMPAKSSQEEWKQCHDLFLEWTSKLKELNEMGIRL